MSDSDIENKLIGDCLDFCRARGLAERGMRIAEEVMRSGPARSVESRSMSPNYTTRFPSRKMGVVIQAESRTIELASIYMKEFDKRVFGYWDQPAHKADLIYKAGKRRTRVQATLDFFVVSEGFIGFEEAKPVEQLHKLCKKSPNRYRYNSETGCYEIPPLEEYLNGTGLGYRIITDRDINKRYVENLAFLYDFGGEAVSEGDIADINALKGMLEALGCMTIGEVERKFSGISRENIFKAIWDREIVADFENMSFSEPEKMTIAFTRQDLAKTVQEDTLINVERLHEGSPDEIQEALRRYKIIRPLLEREKSADEVAADAEVSKRTVFRWKVSYLNHGGIDGLCPSNSKKGNRNSKLPLRAEDLMNEFVENYYLSKSNKNLNHVYQLLKAKCKKEGVSSPSKKTFYSRAREISDTRSNKIREGAKSAYQTTAYVGLCDVPEEGWPFTEATRFLERCHIDHTQMDIELIGDDGVELGKPWLTIIVDEYTSYVLAYYLSFDSPSVINIMCVIRLMVVNHGVFPESVVVDGGKEFESIYFEKLMAKYLCAIISRKGKPRGGGAVERMFGSIDTMVTHNLTGNTTLTKNVRKLSRSHNPKSLAVWGGNELQLGLKEILEYYNSYFPIKDTKSPNTLREESLRISGKRVVRNIEYSDDFYMHILPSPKRSTAKLRRNKNIQVNRVSYWHSSFKAVRSEGETVSLRYDPFNLNHVYIFYKNEWIRCRSVRPQHRKASDLDGAFLAEIRKRLLYLNEKSKESARIEMAEIVERLDQKQSMHEPYHEDEAENVSGSGVVMDDPESQLEEANNFIDLWEIDIPDSSEGES